MKDIDIFVNKIKQANNIAISGHKNPDGDALCSALALAKLIEINFGKKATVIYDGNIPQELEAVPLRKKAIFHNKIKNDTFFDLYILVDYGTKSHLGGADKFITDNTFIIEFDHHYNDDKIGNLCFDDTNKASTTQVIYNIIKQLKLEIDKDIIDLLMIGIITDTGNFKFVRHSDVLIDAGDLVDKGADINILVNLLHNKKRKTVLLEAATTSNAEFYMQGRLVVATIAQPDYKKLDGRGEIVLNLLSQIHGVEYVVLLKEQKTNQIGISIRSRSCAINHIAESFGGGGHLCAAGAVVQDSLQNVHDKIISAFKGL